MCDTTVHHHKGLDGTELDHRWKWAMTRKVRVRDIEATRTILEDDSGGHSFLRTARNKQKLLRKGFRPRGSHFCYSQFSLLQIRPEWVRGPLLEWFPGGAIDLGRKAGCRRKLTSYTARHGVLVKANTKERYGRTTFDEVVVGVASEESVGKEGDYGVDGGHVQYSNAARLALWLHSHQR